MFKDLEKIGFFEWYQTQYGSLNFPSYKGVYDMLPSDNIMISELLSSVMKYFRAVKNINISAYTNSSGYWANNIESKFKYDSYEDAIIEAIKNLISNYK